MLLKKGSKKDPKGIDADHANKMDHKSYLKRGTKEKKNKHLYIETTKDILIFSPYNNKEMKGIKKTSLPKNVIERLNQKLINEENRFRKGAGLAKMTNEQESDHVELFSRHCLYFIDDYGNHYYTQLNYIQI
jgi:hypothetical protein